MASKLTPSNCNQVEGSQVAQRSARVGVAPKGARQYCYAPPPPRALTFVASTSAPAVSNWPTNAVWPFSAATNKGVMPQACDICDTGHKSHRDHRGVGSLRPE
jgi:hypothetical protein